jgi:hypothetical protein
MIARVTFIFIAAFWVTMNLLLWRTEYGSRGGGTVVPPALVWRKILTAPDASSLTIFQAGQRTGFCEFSTSVEQEMAKLDEDRPPPEGLVARAGYQIRLNGNMSLGDFTNRLRFDGRLSFSPARNWRELNLKASSREVTATIHSVATNQTVTLEIKTDGSTLLRVFTFADLQNPSTLIRAVAGNHGADLLSAFDWPVMPQATTALAANLQWEARRDRLMIGHEPVPIYRLETHVLEYNVVIYVSTLGEILRVELPGGVIATLDEWGKF